MHKSKKTKIWPTGEETAIFILLTVLIPSQRLSGLIEDANERVVPLTKMIRKVCTNNTCTSNLRSDEYLQHIENMEARPEDDRNEDELVDQVKPLIEQAEKILNETWGMVKGADPENRLSNRAKRHHEAHTATPEEQRLASALKVVRHISSQ